MSGPFKLKYNNSAFPFKSPLHHDKDADGNVLEEHAHQETRSRSSRNWITISGKYGESDMWAGDDIETGHSSTQGTYADLDEKVRKAEIAKIKASQKKKKNK